MTTVQQCDHVLIPTETRMQNDFKSAQAYVYLNAKYDYERVKNSHSGSAGLGIGYESFTLDYDQSNSADDFQERVRNRLTKMGFKMTESEARSYFKRELGDKQIEAWGVCMADGYVIVTQPSIDAKRATVRVDYRPFKGVRTHRLTMTVAGGRIKDGPVKDLDMGGAFSQTFIVERTHAEKKVTVVASIEGNSDEMILDFGLVDAPLDMLGKTLNIARRAPRWDEPYRAWVPSDINVTALAAPTRWVAGGTEYMAVSVQRFTITFEIANESLYHDVALGPPDFDGFVITGFHQDIKDVKLANMTPLKIAVDFTAREIRINVRGLSPAGPIFVLSIEFAKEDAAAG